MKRVDEYRKKIAQRRKTKQSAASSRKTIFKKKEDIPPWVMLTEEEKHSGSSSFEASSHQPKKYRHPLFNPNAFVLKCLLSTSLVLIAAISFKGQAGPFQQLKPIISQTFEQDFQFAAANRWFEKTVGNPLAFLTDKKEDQKDVQANQELAVPASGKVQESFTQNGAGVKVETSAEAIDSMKEGYVVEVKKKSDTGLTVVVQHADNSYSWYGQLKKANVALYDFVDKGEKIGQISLDDQGKGTYYFAIKQNEQFIDPIQVMTFE
ncbi:M23 family metallopeptidase [Bacillus altitudinis]|uniref:M23 family metallopeptidase n=2 Tax=Bacillus pumilus TaxID=1408 RepID=UPI0025A13EB3|nr:M23 family metallopeptidase [Bacillus pumilus]MDM5320864.1 M23 family metallopeptidase [Bacillus pumilus]MDR4995707.1 M23 family metallopeptidase [Bacillus altitudinis]